MAKVVKYDVTLNELELALSERDLCKDEQTKLANGILGGEKLKEELSDFKKSDIDKTVQVNIKSHGIYLQTDRDAIRNKNKEFTFMIRIPFWGGGKIKSSDYLLISKLAEKYSSDEYGKPSLRLTTRQGIQFHRVTKKNLFPIVQKLVGMNQLILNGAGDNTRNPIASPIKSDVFDAPTLASKLGSYFRLPVEEHLKTFGIENMSDDITSGYKYGKAGLPRKLKMGVSGVYTNQETGELIRDNSSDILTNDLGIAPIIEDKKVTGFQLYIGGGLGQKNGKITFALLGVPLGIVKTEDELIPVIEGIINEWSLLGDRKNRQWARLKNFILKKGQEIESYTTEELLSEDAKKLKAQIGGASWLRSRLTEKGIKLDNPIELNIGKQLRHHGWLKQYDGKYKFGLWVENGRISDSKENMKAMVDEIAYQIQPNIRLTTFQDLLFTDIDEKKKSKLENILKKYNYEFPSDLRRNSLACVGLPTCGLSIADSERYFRPLMNELEIRNIQKIDGISVGISGCERHCSRNIRQPISLEGKGPGYYQLKLLFGKHDSNFLAKDIIYEGKKYLRLVPDKDIPNLIKLLADNFIENRLPEENEIGLFHQRIGTEGIINIIKNSAKLNHLLEKTYDEYFT